MTIQITPTKTLTVEVVEVTPELAIDWLEMMDNNRPISQRNLNSMVKAMNEGRWHQDGTPIRFNTHGRLIDGQHRLNALIIAEYTGTFVVMRGVPAEAMTTLDTGKSRSRADILKVHDPDVLDANNIGAAIAIILRWNEGFRNFSLRREDVPNDDLIKFYDENREQIHETTKAARRVNSHFRAGSSQAFALCHWLFTNLDEEDAEYFWERLLDGAGLEEGNPILALRELLFREGRSAPSRERLRADIVAALTIKAWNAYRKGDEIFLLRFKMGGAHPEKFPEPV